MSRRNLVSTVVLLLLLGIFGRLAYSRAYRVFFAAKPATLAAPYTTEEAWIVDEIVRDITEMALASAAVSPTVLTAAQPGVYSVSVPTSPPATTMLDLKADLWSPTAFAAVATSALGTPRPAAQASGGLTVHADLLDLTATTLVTASDTVSRALKGDLRDPSAHESAALTLAAFALREPVARHGDTRWAMNRMTAHLALAQALRSGAVVSVDGRLAAAVLLTLTGQQVQAMAALDTLDGEAATPAVHAWTRAVRLRITEDWRLLADPRAATRLEQREYLRARRATVRNVTSASDLERLGRAMDVDWFRIVNGSPVGVEDASLVTQALDQERAELDDVYMRLHGRPLVQDGEQAALNALATRCMNGTNPEVLAWGAWAEFGQRRLAGVISRYDSYLRHSVGAGNAADTAKVMLHDQLGQLWTFPSATIWWTKGPRGLEGDDTYVNEAIAAAVAQPQRAPATVWAFLEFAAKYAQVRQFMAPAQAWFFAPAPRTAYEAALRMQAVGLRPVEDFERVLENAPYDMPLVTHYLEGKFGKQIPFEEVERRLGSRLAYDTRAVAWAITAVGDGERSVELLDDACGFSPSFCKQLGTTLAMLGRDADAARAFERALRDEAVDDVAKANWSGWLVDYYHAQGQTGPALQLAEQSAATGAAPGHVTVGRLYERLGRLDEAEAAFRANAEGYDAPGELLGFYYRAVEVRKDAAYESQWQRELERVFPNGLSKDPVPAGPPARGVYVEKDSPDSRKVGLQAGDVIVAVDGWRVDNMVQYRTARAFPLDGGFTLTVARGAARLAVTIANRALVPEFRIANYPVQGWIEK